MPKRKKHVASVPYEAVAEANPMGILLIAPDATIRYVNKAFCKLTGLKKSDLLGKPFTILRDFVVPEDRQKVWEYFQKRIAGKKVPIQYQIRAIMKDGTRKWVEVSAYPIETPEGRLIQATIADITDRKKIEAELERDRHIQRILNQILRLSLEVPSLSEYFESVLGILVRIPWLALEEKGAIFLIDPETQTLRLAAHRNFPMEQLQRCQNVPLGKCICGKAAQQKKVLFVPWVDERHEFRYPGMPPHGHYCVPILYGDEVLGLLNLYVPEGHIYDLEEEALLTAVAAILAGVIYRKRTEEAHRETEELFRTLASTIGAGVFVYQDDRFVYVNKACEELTGYTSEELLQMKFWDVVAPEYQDLVRERGLARQRGEPVPTSYEFKIVRKDGTERWVVFTAGRIQWKGRPAGVGTAFDITDRKRAEEALRESEARFRSIFENATVGIYRTTPDGRILLANPALVRMLGYSTFEELAQRNLEEEGFEPQYPRSKFKELVERNGVVIGLETAWKRRDGSVIFVRESARAVRDPETGKVLYYEGIVEDITDWKKAEQALQEQLEFLRYVIDSLDHPFYVINAETYEIEQANQVLLQGRPLEPGTTCYRLTHQRDVPCAESGFPCPLEEIKRTKQPVVVEHTHYDVHGKEHIYEIHGHPVFDREGNVTRVIEFTIDITPRKRLERALSSLAQSYAHLTGKAFLDAVTQHIAQAMKLDVVFVGELLPNGEQIKVLSAFGMPIEGRIYNLEHTPCEDVINKQLVVYPERVQHLFPKDPELKEWGIEGYIGTPLFDPDHRPLGIMVGLSKQVIEDPRLLEEYFQVFVDRVTAELLRMKADEALRESEERFRMLAESSLTGIYLIQEGKFVYVNQAFESIFGYSVEEIIGKLGPLDLTYPEDRPIVQENIRKRIEGEIDSIRYDFRGLRKDGTVIHIEVHGRRIVYQGKPGIIGTLVDITERKQAEEEIARSHQLLMALSQAAQEVQRARSPEEVYQIVGEHIHRLGYDATIFEYDAEQHLLRVAHLTLSPEEKKVLEGILQRPVEGFWIPIKPGSLYYRILTLGKTVFIATDEISEEGEPKHPSPSFYQWAKQLGWEHNIIAPLKTQEKTLGFLAVSGKGLTEADVRVISIFANQAAVALENARLYRETRELATFNQRIIENVADGIVIQDRNGVFTFVNPSAAKILGYQVQELIGKHAMDVVPEDQRPILEEIQQRRVHGVTDRYELDLLKKDGTRIHALISATPLFDEQGNFVGSLSVFTDITALKKAEEEQERLREQLFQAQKLEAIGRLAGGIAHDFNNILTAIMGHAELGMMKIHPGDPVYLDLKEIFDAAKRSADLTSKLLGFARKQTILPKVQNLNETITGMLGMLRRLIGEDIELKWVPGTDLWNIRIDPQQVNQILTNLLVNAKDAGARVVTIETENITIEEPYLEKHPYFKPGYYVVLSVSDDGCGMDEETLQHIFEPFFTTKEPGKGTGLGLSTVYGIVKQNDGFIHVYSELGVGTTFKIYFPRHEGETEEGHEEEGRLAPGHGETVLLVEDEAKILSVVKAMLEQLGYRVLTANRPHKALEIARKHAGQIDLLLTDVVMPEMSGKELAEQLTQLFPNLKVLYMSGYTANHIANHGVLDPGVAFVSKPLRIQELAKKVREVLDHKRS